LSCLDKLEEVWDVRQLQASEALTRELAVVKVRLDALGAETVVAFVAAGSIRVLERRPDTAIVEITGASADVDAIVQAMPPASVIEIARLGPLMMSRGAEPTTVADAPATRNDHT
jgi:acetolactate synthase-1/3 small subunit